jgi:hypothetical protein
LVKVADEICAHVALYALACSAQVKETSERVLERGSIHRVKRFHVNSTRYEAGEEDCPYLLRGTTTSCRVAVGDVEGS